MTNRSLLWFLGVLALTAIPVGAIVPRPSPEASPSPSPVPSVSIPVIHVDGVTTPIVKMLLERHGHYRIVGAGLKDDPEVFIATSDSGMPIYAKVNTENKTIEFLVVCGLVDDVPESESLAMANRMNAKARLPRFYIEENELRVEYTMLYDEGLSPQQLIATMFEFEHETHTLLHGLSGGKLK